ncbi:MAG TPA: hypothetical protein VFV50_02375 [Bdellovibrionales bacterium]|nr:hypothetical protein [Bdellovibrionales bacterium]
MGKLDWIRDLVRAEQQLEEADMVDFSFGFDHEKTLTDETISFLEQLKEAFVDYAVAFNQMKGVPLGNIKIYGIANTRADFMLFRNGMKLVFSMKKPGSIGVSFHHQKGLLPGTGADTPGTFTEDLIEAQWGAFNELVWTHKNLKLNVDNMVRYYLSHFIRESAK